MCRIRTAEIVTHYPTMSLKQHAPATAALGSVRQTLFGARLKEPRRETDLTHSALAESPRVTRRYVAKIERASVKPALVAIAAVTRVQSMVVADMLQLSAPPEK